MPSFRPYAFGGTGVQKVAPGWGATVPGAQGVQMGAGKYTVPFTEVSAPLRHEPAGQADRNGPGTL